MLNAVLVSLPNSFNCFYHCSPVSQYRQSYPYQVYMTWSLIRSFASLKKSYLTCFVALKLQPMKSGRSRPRLCGAYLLEYRPHVFWLFLRVVLHPFRVFPKCQFTTRCRRDHFVDAPQRLNGRFSEGEKPPRSRGRVELGPSGGQGNRWR